MSKAQRVGVTGIVSPAEASESVSGLRVEAWEADEFIPQSLGSAVTDADGGFIIAFDSKYYVELCLERRPDIYFKIYRKNQLLYSTSRKVTWNAKSSEKSVRIPLPAPPPASGPGDPIYRRNNWNITKPPPYDNLGDTDKKNVSKLLDTYIRSQLERLIGPERPGLKALVSKLSLDFEVNRNADVYQIVADKIIKPGLKNSRLKKEAASLNGELTGRAPMTLSAFMALETPLDKHPAVTADLRRYRTREYAGILGLSSSSTHKLVEKDVDFARLSEGEIDVLISDRIVTKEKRKDLRRLVDLDRLSGGNVALVKALEGMIPDSIADFIGWDVAKWEKVLTDSRIPLPEGEDAKSYAEALRSGMEATFPSEFMLSRLTMGKHQRETGLIDSAETLASRGDFVLGGLSPDLSGIDWSGTTPAERDSLKTDIHELNQFANSYGRMGLIEILRDKTKSPADKKHNISSNLSALHEFTRNNPGIDLERTDFIAAEPHLDWTGIEPGARPLITRQMMAYQRVRTLAADSESSQRLLRNGLDSAFAIVRLSESQFISAVGLDHEHGVEIYNKARDRALGATHWVEAIRDTQSGPLNSLTCGNTVPLVNDLEQIDGFEDFFGSQNFCSCTHCRSIFGPAAYFVDLMYFIQKKVSSKTFTADLRSHPLYLKKRRPDLWTLQLTCKNTNEEIPYLQVVNEVLEHYLENTLGVDDVYEMLWRNATASALPFNLPLNELRMTLGHFELKLSEIYWLLNEPQARQHAEILGLSKEEVAIINTPNTARARTVFGNLQLPNFRVQDFIRFAEITRENLTELLTTSFLPQISNVKVKTIRSDSDIQLYDEVLDQLTAERLDQIHRLVRLWKATPWTLPEFDLILISLRESGLVGNLEDSDSAGDPAFLVAGELVRLQGTLNLSPEELCVLSHEIPDKPTVKDERSLYSRLFNLEEIFASVGGDGSPTYETQATLPADKSQDKVTALLLAGLGVSESDFAALTTLLDIDTTVDQTVNKVLLSKLFRHVLVAKGLGLNIEEMISVLRLTLGGSAITSLDDIQELINFEHWRRLSPFSVSEVALIVMRQETSARRYKYDVAGASRLVRNIQATFEVQKAADPQRYNPTINDLLRDQLQAMFNLTDSQLKNKFFDPLTSVHFNSDSIHTALAATFDDSGEPVHPSHLDGLVELLREFERLDLLFGKLQFGPTEITFLINLKEVFGISDLKNLDQHNLRTLCRYKSLVDSGRDLEAQVQTALRQYKADGGFSVDSVRTLAALWKQSQSQIQSIVDAAKFSSVPIEAAHYLQTLNDVCKKLGIEGHSLIKLRADDYPGLQTARNTLVGAFESKYPDETIRKEITEPYQDQLNTLKRDALCSYIIARKDTFKFRNRRDLYNFFLLHVEMSGCFRTSRVVSAISSLQTYVHRCLLNLERSDKDLNPRIPDIKVPAQSIPADEWQWRKNYRVWEANRKVFLYPENYIVPDLRPDKTLLFKELEQELLQENISRESAEKAYKTYLAGFAELSNLRYAGAYYQAINYPAYFMDISLGTISAGSRNALYNSVPKAYLRTAGPIAKQNLIRESAASHYYLFARTNTQPYRYYYRTYNPHRNIWGNWESIELAIDAREISPVVHQGKLYIFWTEVRSKEITKISGGDATPSGVQFSVCIKYSFLDEKNKWAAPQRQEVGHTLRDENSIYDRILRRSSTKGERDKLHEAVFAKYQEILFRKPYATRSNRRKTPLHLSYIWTHEEGVKRTEYTTMALPCVLRFYASAVYPSMNPWIELDFKFHLPSFTFLAENGRFASDPLVNVRVNNADDIDFGGLTFKGTADIDLMMRSGKCRAEGVITIRVADTSIEEELEWHREIPYTINDLPIDIHGSAYQLSLAGNAIIPKTPGDETKDLFERSDFYSLTDPAVSPLAPEYDLVSASEADGEYARHVETGSTDFCDRGCQLHQTAEGQATLIHRPTSGDLRAVKLSTILTDELSDIFFADGLKSFLDLKTQQIADGVGQRLDFSGPYGAYYWELFFHIPFLIANHLNANQKFDEARWWYERIFNPTAGESLNDARPGDHNWRFREFRNLDVEKLKDILVDSAAIETYKNDPFNAHAIARLRLNAYQKTVVMRYVDNLIDWGDHLFAQDTRESIHEAEILYQLASEILGDRPAEIGECTTASGLDLTYENLGSRIDEDSEFLIYVENVSIKLNNRETSHRQVWKEFLNFKELDASRSGALDRPRELSVVAEVATAKDITGLLVGAREELEDVLGERVNSIRLAGKRADYQVADYKLAHKSKARGEVGKTKWIDAEGLFEGQVISEPTGNLPGPDVVTQTAMAFCVPGNKNLLEYWDRVEDRLFKIRHCMNISGIRRSLALFQPPIDPMMLVRARAAGLSLEEISSLMAGVDAPNYRFSFLSDKAKQAAQMVQGFGNALLSALEKKDLEELSQLSSLHELNIQRLTKSIKEKQVKEAQAQYATAEQSLTHIADRIEHYRELIGTGLTGWESAQQAAQHTATVLKLAESEGHLGAGITYLMGQVGSPFAMTYGGIQLGRSRVEFAQWSSALAGIADQVASSAGLEATFQRREEEWRHQLRLAMVEQKQAEKQLVAADLRVQIAEKDLAMHQRTMEQTEEIHEFQKGKFTNLGLYDYLSSSLNRLYRQAYSLAYDMAKLAERAYQFEMNPDVFFIANDNWQFDRSGLLAVEKLLLQIQEMDQDYLKKNSRKPEITQSISLVWLDPSQLLTLRQTGYCNIVIPEIVYELLYPGQYKRLIKSVRLTIPCVAGPYTNVSAKLSLLESQVQRADQGALTEIGVAKNTSITTSSANSDAGVFELTFRDERYLPFEGAGAISEWKLELPSVFRSFDYDTIADVILHISYTAEDGDRAAAETNLASLIVKHAKDNGLFRLFSLRREFPNSFHQLIQSPSGQDQLTQLDIGRKHFPFVFAGRVLNISECWVFLKPKSGEALSTPPNMTINGVAVSWNSAEDVAHPASSGSTTTPKPDTIRGGTIASLTGSPVIKTWSINAGIGGLDTNKLEDVIVLLRYGLAS